MKNTVNFQIEDPEDQVVKQLREEAYGRFFDDDESLNSEFVLEEIPEDDKFRTSVFAA